MTNEDDTAPFYSASTWVEPIPYTPMPWTYDQSDPAITLYTRSMERFGFSLPSHSHILELGCAETDWLERMKACDQTYQLTGVDVRREDHRLGAAFTFVQGDAANPRLFYPESFDWIVLLGALEHFGLGFPMYGDPINDDADTQTMRNVSYWLKPGGFVYFDVPCNPEFSIRENRHFRTYSPASVQQRLVVPGLVEINRAYSLCEPHAGTWCHEPTVRVEPYHFVAVLAQKR